MSFQNPLNRTRRRSVAGMEMMHSKMFDPPNDNVITPERLAPTNPVPEVMAANGTLDKVDTPHTVERDLMHGETIDTWDNQRMNFFLFADPDGVAQGGLDVRAGTFPGPTIRVPRGVIFHCHTKGSPSPPHTIHWHGQEPTTMNDGVGHTSFELGEYTYQWQPNFIGSYFHHCHRNTMQHFEFGLYGFTVIDPPDAYFASIAAFIGNGGVTLNTTPVGAGRDGLFRTAANLSTALNPTFERFNQDNFNPLDTPDPEANNQDLPPWLRFATDPHAYTVPYAVEALWVLDDRDIRWSNLTNDVKSTFPIHGSIPGVNDNFHSNGDQPVLPGDFFAFNDFRSTHWYVTGVEFPGAFLTSASVPEGLLIPAAAMSGKSGVQVSINAGVNQNILIRILNAAYNTIKVTFPVEVVIIAWDGRALGVPPFGRYNAPVAIPAGTPVEFSTARRVDCMINSAVPVNDPAIVEFYDSLRLAQKRFTGLIPIHIN